MAIIVDPEKKSVNWVTMISVLIIIGVLFAGGYFLFFKKPDLIEIVVPNSLDEISKISKLTFDPAGVINSPTFKILKRYDSNIQPATAGRTNPFKPF